MVKMVSNALRQIRKLINPGKEYAGKYARVDEDGHLGFFEGGGSEEIIGIDPINTTSHDGHTDIDFNVGEGLTVDDNGYCCVDVDSDKGLQIVNGKLKVKIEEENSTIGFNLQTGEIYANINGMLHNGEDITFDSWGPQLPRAVKPNINGKITTGQGILYATTQSLCGATAIKEALSVKQNQLSAPVSGGLIINGQMDNLIGINVKNAGGIAIDENGQVLIDDTVIQKKLTAGSGITIDARTNTITAKKEITTGRVKVIGTGASGDPPSITIGANATYSLDITNYVESVRPSGYKVLSQGSMFCISLGPDTIIPCFFYYYNNRYNVRLMNTTNASVTANNMWIEILYQLDE